MSAHKELDALKQVERHYAVFEDFVAQAEGYLNKGQYNAAAVYAEIAATYATEQHAGLFASPRLEAVLLAIGQNIAEKDVSSTRTAPSYETPQRVLHVLTEAAGIGGHTRMVWRWILQDSGRRHSVVLTRQGFVKVPPALKDAVGASKGQITVLNDRIGNLLTWSRDLRRLARSADVIVLHIYTDDVIPVIAFAEKISLPPVIYLNHADHKFWLGLGISDLVVHQRDSGARLSERRRGIDPSRFGFLPVTLVPMPRTLSRPEAKQRLGLPSDSVLLLSIARPSKYIPLNGLGERLGGSEVNELVLPNSVLPVLQKYPNTTLIVIGPAPDERWAAAAQSVQGRIKVLGRREDTAVFYQAADIYLDSFPFTSITSLLEAANYGLPLVSCYPYSSDCEVLSADTPALIDTVVRARNVSDYRSAVSHLIENAGDRTARGNRTRERVLSVHSGDNWERSLNDLYLQAARARALNPQAGAPVCKEDTCTVGELDVLSTAIDRTKDSPDRCVQDHLRLLPASLRLSLWARTLNQQDPFPPSLLLPEWLAMRMIKTRARLRNGWT